MSFWRVISAMQVVLWLWIGALCAAVIAELVTWTGEWFPAACSGLLWSMYRRQCEARGELEQSAPPRWH